MAGPASFPQAGGPGNIVSSERDGGQHFLNFKIKFISPLVIGASVTCTWLFAVRRCTGIYYRFVGWGQGQEEMEIGSEVPSTRHRSSEHSGSCHPSFTRHRFLEHLLCAVLASTEMMMMAIKNIRHDLSSRSLSECTGSSPVKTRLPAGREKLLCGGG